MKTIKYLLVVLAILPLSMFAQSTTGAKQSWPIKISVLDESIAIPTLGFFRWSYNPAVTIGTEYQLKTKEKSEWYLGADTGFYYHKDWSSAVFLTGSIGYRRQFGRWNASAKLGTGYAHTFLDKPLYKNEAGTWVKVKERGNPTLMTSLGLEIGYQLKDDPLSPVLFASFTGSFDVPFDIYTGLRQFAGVGVKFYPNFLK